MSVRKLALDNKKMDFKTMQEPAVPSPGLMNSEGNTESGAEKVARTDPHGGVLTLTSVSVVFAALLILLIIFTIMGNVFSGKYKRKPKKGKSSIDADTAAAIAMALDLECGDDGTAAAIATAIHLYLEDSVHDSESFVITITPRSSSWNNKKDMFRKPVR
jgi:sodium pump decarboxylase gamma subunit